MRRRAVLGGLAVMSVVPSRAWAQPGKVPRLGILGNIPPEDIEGARVWGALTQGLRELGYIEGQSIVVEHLTTAGRAERLPTLAAELVQWRPDVIVVPNNTNAIAAREATRTIPIVAATLFEGSGLIGSLGRPGGNVTGMTLFSPETTGKQLELMREIVPGVRRVAILSNPVNPSVSAMVDQARSAAGKLGLQLQILQARRPEDLDGAFAAMSRERAGALLLISDAMLILQRHRIAVLATKAKLPVMYTLREHMGAAGFACYGPSMIDNFRRAATYVDKILKGARPADLPVERPTRYELVINLSAARAIGLTVPPSVLARADQVIQ